MKKTVGIDSSFLIVLLDIRARASVANGPELVGDLIEELTAEKATVIIPTPVLTELLIGSREVQAALEEIKTQSCFQVRPFDEKAAIELAQVFQKSVESNKRKRKGLTKQTITFDRQIVAICKVNGASVIYSDDQDVVNFANECGMDALRFRDLKRREKQQPLEFDRTE